MLLLEARKHFFQVQVVAAELDELRIDGTEVRDVVGQATKELIRIEKRLRA